MLDRLNAIIESNIFVHILLILLLIVIIFPVYYSFIVSSSERVEVYERPPTFTPGDQLATNFYRVWHGTDLPRALFNSTVFSLSVTFGKLIISLMTAYAIVFFDFKLAAPVFFLTLFTLMMPVPVRLMSTYEVVSSLGMIDTYQGLILPMIASATGTFLFRQIFKTIPNELAEATVIDGGGPLQFLFHVLLPLVKTNAAALFVILFIWTWNQYLWPLLITTSSEMRVVQLGIEGLIPGGGQLPDWTLIMPYVVSAMVPPLVVILGLQRYFVKGLIEPNK